MTTAVQSRDEKVAGVAAHRAPCTPVRFRAEGLLATTAPGEDRPPRLMVGLSVALHLVLLGTILVLATQVRRPVRPERIDVVFFPSGVEELPPPAPVELPEPEVTSPPPPPEPPVEIARPFETAPPVQPAPPVAQRPVRRQRRREPVAPPVPPVVTPTPEPPRPTVRTDLFEEARTEPVAAPTPKLPTRTGTFATPAQPVARQRSELRARGSARVGGFEVTATPDAPAPVEPDGQRVVAKASFGGEPAASAAAATPRAERRAVTTAGFAGSATSDAPRKTSGTSGSVRQGAFGEAVEAPRPRRSKDKPVANPDTPVEILSKPKPVYTAEARELNVEGEVVLEVTFVASGQLRVLDVVESLGHGLDEAAIEAAKNIQFTPALRNGQPIDYTAVLRIVFQLV